MRLRTLPVKYLMMHCSATADHRRTLSWGVIRDNHLALGWDDIGYHAGVEVTRDRVECLYGRPDNYVGGHCRGWNSVSMGFCFVGDYEDDPPSDELLTAAAERVIVPWLLQYQLGVSAIVPHRQFNAGKTCPGSAFDVGRLQDICTRILERR